MSLDIGDILDDWPYEPGQVTARKIRGDDGREKIQLRLDLGLLQMETSGRPDGQRPHGCESLLAYHNQRLRRHREETGGDEGFELTPEDCELLRSEGVMFYHRYLAAFILEDFDSVVRDATRNLRLFDFCRAYATEESDRYVLEQYRPYVTMMQARARARLAMQKDDPARALRFIERGIGELEAFYDRAHPDESPEESGELAVLEAMAAEIRKKIPPDPVDQLREDLAAAVREERYEDAAVLRDRLRQTLGQD